MKTKTWLDMDGFDKFSTNGTRCKVCNKPLDPDISGMKEISNGWVCDDCYFEEWGKEIDRHPIHNPIKYL